MTVSTIQGFDETGQPDFVLERGIDRADRGADETDRRADEACRGVGGGIGEASQNAGQFLCPPEPGAQGQWRKRDEAEGQVPCRRSPAAASEPDAAARCPDGSLRALSRRCERGPASSGSRLDRIEIPEIVPDVTRVTLHGGVCPCCRRRFRAAPPAGLAPGSPFGPNLRAFVLYLRFAQAIPFERLARLMSDLLGLEISEGALANMLEASGSAFADQTSLIRDRLLSGTVLQSDETSARVGNKTWWTWVFHNGDSACFLIRPSRGKAVVGEFLGTMRPDFWVSDRLAAQMGWAQTAHQACLAHLLRDVQYAIDAGDISFAPGIKNLLKQAIAIGHRRDRLADATLAVYAARLEAKLDRLLQIEPANRQGQKLLRIIKKYRQNLFVFVTSRAVPPTNNGSEQALRPCVIFRKITNCFRSHWGARLYVDVRSVFETARRRGSRSFRPSA